jgi:hypothetical protein
MNVVSSSHDAGAHRRLRAIAEHAKVELEMAQTKIAMHQNSHVVGELNPAG